MKTHAERIAEIRKDREEVAIGHEYPMADVDYLLARLDLAEAVVVAVEKDDLGGTLGTPALAAYRKEPTE